MTEILTSAQMRSMETAAIESGAVSGRALMERAGAGVVQALCAHWPDGPRRAVVLCGPGNNGGDGYVVARLLLQQGWQVTLWALSPPTSPDAIANADAWAALGGVAVGLDPSVMQGAVVVDALFGTGLARDLAPDAWAPLAMAQAAGARLVAVDILSGLCADSGRVRATGAYPTRGADLTVTFQAPKRGHVLLPGGAMSGALQVVDIGLAAELAALVRDQGEQVAAAIGPPGARLDKSAGHKFDHGHALVLSGGVGRGGAARLAARAALRVGAGLVTLGCPPAAVIENAARLDAVMLRALADDQALTGVLADGRITALCLGPGLGLGGREAALVAAALKARRPTVLDADALTLIAGDAGLRALVHPGCVLTPHAGEFARLWPALVGADCARVPAVMQAAADIGATVLLKGPDTVIAAPDGRPQIHAALRGRAAPWLATAGAGDVLAGLIAGLLARGWSATDAAAAATWLHVEAALHTGPGLIAEDLPDALPAVLRARLSTTGPDRP